MVIIIYVGRYRQRNFFLRPCKVKDYSIFPITYFFIHWNFLVFMSPGPLWFWKNTSVYPSDSPRLPLSPLLHLTIRDTSTWPRCDIIHAATDTCGLTPQTWKQTHTNSVSSNSVLCLLNSISFSASPTSCSPTSRGHRSACGGCVYADIHGERWLRWWCILPFILSNHKIICQFCS